MLQKEKKMPVPKKHQSKARSRKRRTHYKASAPTLVACPRCGATRLPHRACPECGFYRDEKVMKKTKAEKKIEKELEKA